jgi:CRP/FNR family transcriptional regulator, cyclic AMP receptor protein
MASISTAFAPGKRLEDPLEYLPCSKVIEYQKGEMIYGVDQAPVGIYLVMTGGVTVSRLRGQHQVIVDIYRRDEFFGESTLLKLPQSCELTTAFENTNLMVWSGSEINDLIMKRPGLALALVQIFVQRIGDLTQRIESLSQDTVPRRLARSLVRLSERLGSREEDGSLRMAPLTHEMLAQYVGTSREIITHYMNHFRKRGYLQYSRKEILVYNAAWQEWSR